MAKLSSIADYVTDKISSNDIALHEYVTTDCILQNKKGREIATNLPPQPCCLTRYQRGDVLIANIRPYLKKVWFADIDGGASSDVLVFRAKEGHSPSFLYAVLLQDSFFDYVMQGVKGSKMPRGDKEQILRYEMPTLSCSEESIGTFFLNLDYKIQLSEQINQNLEAMAKQLYDYWFVQFDFPNEEGKPYKSSGGEMVWNEKLKREIPKEWEIRPLNSLITVKDGTHESPKQQLEGRYLITSKHLLSSGIDYNTAYYISAEDYIAINKRSQVETNDILFSMIGTIGNKYLVAEKNVNFAIKNMALLKTSKSMHIMYFLWLYLSSWDYKHYEFNAISGSIQKFLSLDAMRNIPVPFNYDIAVAFNKQVSNICQCIINLKEENIQLIKQRNELLPLLMNGQVSVNSDLSVYKKRRGKVPSLILNDVSDIQVLHRQSIIVLVKDSSIDEL